MTTKLDNFFKDQGIQPMGTLAHFGIKGQKWGVRRSDSQLSSNSADAARAAATQTAIKKGGVSSVSDADLNHLVNRVNLQKRYSEVTSTKGNTSLTKTVSKSTKTLLAVGEVMNKAISFANSPAGRILATKVGLYKPGSGKHAGLAKMVIDIPGPKSTKGKHRA
jgi:hypothetical protein